VPEGNFSLGFSPQEAGFLKPRVGTKRGLALTTTIFEAEDFKKA